MPRHLAYRLLPIAVAYAAFVVYGSLVPLQFRPRTLASALDAFAHIQYLRLGVASRADWVANILLYIPLAFLLTGAAMSARRAAARVAGVVATIAFCIALAVAVEFAQLFFPPRTVSQNDLIAETLGTLIGAGLWFVAGRRLVDLAGRVRIGGPAASVAAVTLYVIAYLGYSLFPFDFLVSEKELAAKLAATGVASWVLSDSCGGILHCNAKLFAEILLAAPLGALYGMLRGARAGYGRAFLWGALLGAAIEGMQIFLASGVTQGLSVLTRGLGMLWGLAFYRFFRFDWLARHRTALRRLAWIAAPVYLVAVLALKGLLPLRLEAGWAAAEKLGAMSFLPFFYHYFTTETEALRSLMVNAGLYVPVGVIAWISAAPGRDRRTRWLAAAAAAGLAFGVETLSIFTVGKRGDPTNLLIAAATAYLVALLAQWLEHGFPDRAGTPPGAALPSGEAPRPRHLALKLSSAVIGAVVLVGGLVVATPHREQPVDESVLPKLPPGRDLPPPDLPGFRFTHPRLPHPSPLDVEVLRARNPEFLAAQARAANGGRGQLEASILTEFVAPGTQDLDLLVRRLLELKYGGRGHHQAMPVVVAYDWLYGRFNPSQQEALRTKVAEGCDYLIEVIRTERHSPYNVVLYNAPFQALVACAIALYRDDVRGEPTMRFTADLWKNRVLPVWRQVMGRHGGWHEGGEYVGIGIGQAIYRVPAMWRAATGEDLFLEEPGIRGFLDFVIYRTQPDGSHIRLGDGAWFDRSVPDALPLALEYRHAAAYTFLRPSVPPLPTSWPWGPLTDSTLADPGAVARLPLVRHFDGIGLVVARSDWTPGATHVTFKAGDNYWSHVHLDQGAFTIFKGGPLAIDSGVYTAYGSAHHMNYAYQTVAHNTITVTDPKDTVPAPGRDRPRPIANDGGQRRVGSGWGVEAAPLDRAEWEAKRETYHTGRIERVTERDGLLVVESDLTPAYTNRLSGAGTFSHRTRRVERFRRVFGYDRIDDVVVVFDEVRATDAGFRKRWLLHTVEKPELGKDRFAVLLPPAHRLGWSGGRLDGFVLHPVRPVLTAIGGRGFEFFVGDRNYDEGGKLQEAVAKFGRHRPVPGAWRIELTPEREALDDAFLVVMVPSAGAQPPSHAVRRLEEAGRIGCEVVGPRRTTVWRFDLQRGTVDVQIRG